MDASSVQREPPRIYRRASTAMTQSRLHLNKATVEMRLALEILGDLHEPGAPWPEDPDTRRTLLEPLQEVLTRIDGARAALQGAWAPFDVPAHA